MLIMESKKQERMFWGSLAIIILLGFPLFLLLESKELPFIGNVVLCFVVEILGLCLLMTYVRKQFIKVCHQFTFAFFNQGNTTGYIGELEQFLQYKKYKDATYRKVVQLLAAAYKACEGYEQALQVYSQQEQQKSTPVEKQQILMCKAECYIDMEEPAKAKESLYMAEHMEAKKDAGMLSRIQSAYMRINYEEGKCMADDILEKLGETKSDAHLIDKVWNLRQRISILNRENRKIEAEALKVELEHINGNLFLMNTIQKGSDENET